MYFKSNAKIKIFKRLPNLDFEMTQMRSFIPFFFFLYHQYFSSQLLQYLKKKLFRSHRITNTVSLVHLEKLFIVLRIT